MLIIQTCPGTCILPSYSTGSKGLPVANTARPCENQTVSPEPWLQTRLHSFMPTSIIIRNFGEKNVTAEYWYDNYLAPCVSLFSSAFRLWRWVGQGKNEWSLHVIENGVSFYLCQSNRLESKQVVIVKSTSLNEEMASITSCVKVCPFPDVPISTVGLIA